METRWVVACDAWEPGETMTIWFTADRHLGHRNISRYCNRPFSDVDTTEFRPGAYLVIEALISAGPMDRSAGGRSLGSRLRPNHLP